MHLTAAILYTLQSSGKSKEYINLAERGLKIHEDDENTKYLCGRDSIREEKVQYSNTVQKCYLYYCNVVLACYSTVLYLAGKFHQGDGTASIDKSFHMES